MLVIETAKVNVSADEEVTVFPFIQRVIDAEKGYQLTAIFTEGEDLRRGSPKANPVGDYRGAGG